MLFCHVESPRCLPIRSYLARWLDEPTSTACDRLPAEEDRVLREQLGDRRLRLNDDQRRRRAAKAKRLGGTILEEIATKQSTNKS